MERAVVSWSGGKDAAFALYELRDGPIVVEELLTTVSETTDRSSMHGVRRELYEAQAAALGLPITVIELPDSPSNAEYEETMNDQMHAYHERGFDRVVFGDLALEDVRRYREDRLEDCPIDGCWPIWGTDTREHMDRFLDAGFEAIVVAVNDEHFSRADPGITVDRSFLEALPEDVDPAGEHGAFHTFVADGPGFDERVPVELGERVTREVGEGTTMHYVDLELGG